VTTVVDVATGPSPAEKAATESFTTAARNLQEFGERAGVQRIVVVSIIGIDRFKGGYQAAKLEHERLSLAGAIPARILRATQFHEFVAELIEWGRKGAVSYVPKMRTQLVSARTVAEALAELATEANWATRRRRRFRRSPARARRASSRPRGYSFPAAAIACGSRRSAARTSSTQT
jgi:hypothetical protein